MTLQQAQGASLAALRRDHPELAEVVRPPRPRAAARCGDCGRPLAGGWIERPGQPAICLSCDTARWVRGMRAASREPRAESREPGGAN